MLIAHTHFQQAMWRDGHRKGLTGSVQTGSWPLKHMAMGVAQVLKLDTMLLVFYGGCRGGKSSHVHV